MPATKDLCSGYRYYAIAQIDRAVRIRALVGLGFSLDDEGNDCDVEVALPITGAVTVRDPAVEVRVLPGCRALSVLHRGPYENLPLAHRQVREYLDAHGLSQNGPEREIYLNDPSEVAAEDLVTEIQYPVRD